MKQPKKIDKSKLKYRKGVVAIIIDKECEFLIMQGNSYADHQWKFIGGGREKIDKSAEDNLFREIKEELGLEKEDFDNIKVSKHPIKYDFPDELIKEQISLGNALRGQKKEVFVIRFIGNKEKIKIDKDEIRKIKWVTFQELKDHLVFPGQYEHYLKVINELIPKVIN